METLMTVLKRFWPNFKLKKTVNWRMSASRKEGVKDVFKDSYSFNSEQFTTTSGKLRTFKILIVLSLYLYSPLLKVQSGLSPRCFNMASSCLTLDLILFLNKNHGGQEVTK